MASHARGAIWSTSPGYKEWEREMNQAIKRNTERKAAAARKTAIPAARQTRALTKTERQTVANMLKKHNAEIRNFYGLKQLPAGCEIR